MRALKFFFAVAVVLVTVSSCKKDEESCAQRVNDLKINNIQMLASHNSYRIRTYDPILQFMYANPQMLPEGFNPDDWDYTHEPLEDQFDDYGIRSIELDVYYDPAGGLFYNRMGLAVLGMSPESREPALLEPGLKVLHVPDLDYQTHALTFKQALQTVKTWSENNPNHLPMVIQVEPKEDNLFLLLGPPFTNSIPFDQTALETIDQEIKAVFGENLTNVITPDDVRKNYNTLNAAIRNGAWPDLLSARGKIMFVMDGSGNETADYLNGHPSLSGRAMFVYAQPGQPEAAFLKYENPCGYVSEIQGYVTQGYMIRTRADADTKEARSGDTGRREAAFACGAQIVSTDYYRPDPRGAMSPDWTGYIVNLPGDYVARLNPVNGPQEVAGCPILEE